MKKKYLFTWFITAIAAVSLAAQSTRRLYIEEVSVASKKADGNHWDIWSGKPDLKLILSVDRDGRWKEFFATKRRRDTYIISYLINTGFDVKSGDKIKFDVIDEDLKNDDVIGSHVLEVPELDLTSQEPQQLSFGSVSKLVFFYSKYKELKLNFTREQMAKAERQLGTDSDLDRLYHKIVYSPFASTLRFPGYIIGIEKTVRKKIGMGDVDNFAKYIDVAPEACNETEKEFIARRIDDYSCQFVSHIAEYETAAKNPINIGKSDEEIELTRTFVYDIYSQIIHDKASADQAFAKGWQAVADLKAKLAKKIRRHDITHIFLFSMGWDTSQTQAIKNFNELFGRVVEEGRTASGGLFRPLFIGITWHSKWTADSISEHWEFIQNKASYISKANDADEIGLLWINHLLRRVLIPLKNERNCRFVIVGHSFGTRLLTRGIFSFPLLHDVPAPKKDDIDLFIGLQGAFDVKRFIKEEGREGSPYRGFKDCARKFVLTWSLHDKATAIAKWADFAGDLRGYRKSCQYENTVFQTALDASGQWEPQPPDDDKIVMVDATKVVSGHSDIYKEEVCSLVWKALGQ